MANNLPLVPNEKFEEGVIRKIYGQIGVIKEEGFWMFVDPNMHIILGHCFIEFNTPQEVELSKEETQGYQLDKAHFFVVNLFDDIGKFTKVLDEWDPP